MGVRRWGGAELWCRGGELWRGSFKLGGLVATGRYVDAHAHQGKKDIMIVICSFINTAPQEDVKPADHVSTIANHPNSTKEKKKRKEEAHEFRSRRRRTRRRRKEMMTKYALLLYSTTKQGAGRSKTEALSKVGGDGEEEC
jgi:hypothetical protein